MRLIGLMSLIGLIHDAPGDLYFRGISEEIITYSYGPCIHVVVNRLNCA
jgi:hypothetical protein